MTVSKQSPEALAAPRALENDLSSRLVNSKHIAKSTKVQYRLVATVAKSGREEFRVAIAGFNGIEKIEVRVFERGHDGTWKPTPRLVVIGRGAVADVIAALCEAEARL